MSTRWQVLRDPDWGLRLARLKARLADQTGRPLVLLLGSSRAAAGLRPDRMVSTWTSRSPMVFNFARRGVGPMVSLLYLQRLLDEGVRPDWVLLEFWPFFLSTNNVFGRDDAVFDVRRLQWRDRAAVERDLLNGREQMRLWLRFQLVPWFWQRGILMSYFAPDWGKPEQFTENFWAETDEWGWRDVRALTHDRYGRAVEWARPQVKEMVDGFALDPAAGRRVSDILERCREEVIPVSLLYLPESSDLRSWYSASMLEQTDAYLRSLEQRFAVPVVDARDWVADQYFFDTHHLGADGAAVFSQQLAEATGVPVAGQPLAVHESIRRQ